MFHLERIPLFDFRGRFVHGSFVSLRFPFFVIYHLILPFNFMPPHT